MDETAHARINDTSPAQTPQLRCSLGNRPAVWVRGLHSVISSAFERVEWRTQETPETRANDAEDSCREEVWMRLLVIRSWSGSSRGSREELTQPQSTTHECRAVIEIQTQIKQPLFCFSALIKTYLWISWLAAFSKQRRSFVLPSLDAMWGFLCRQLLKIPLCSHYCIYGICAYSGIITLNTWGIGYI